MLVFLALVALAFYVVWGMTTLRRALAGARNPEVCWSCLEDPCTCSWGS